MIKEKTFQLGHKHKRTRELFRINPSFNILYQTVLWRVKKFKLAKITIFESVFVRLRVVRKLSNGDSSRKISGDTRLICSESRLTSSSISKVQVLRKATYSAPSSRPVLFAKDGIRLDFNEGCRVQFPRLEKGSGCVRLKDMDTGNVLFDRIGLNDAFVRSSKCRHVYFGIASYILRGNPDKQAAKISFPDEGRPIDQPYVCIPAQAPAQCKYWNNPTGWPEVISWLKRQSYRAIYIDQKSVYNKGMFWNHIPYGAEDQTGDRPLTKRARSLRHAAFFIGNSSGLAWLAWSVGISVVTISGFIHPTSKFATSYSVINWHACNSCWNDPKECFDHQNFLWCLRHANTPRQFECASLITASQVISASLKLFQRSTVSKNRGV